jgi:hypothetical protein
VLRVRDLQRFQLSHQIDDIGGRHITRDQAHHLHAQHSTAQGHISVQDDGRALLGHCTPPHHTARITSSVSSMPHIAAIFMTISAQTRAQYSPRHVSDDRGGGAHRKGRAAIRSLLSGPLDLAGPAAAEADGAADGYDANALGPAAAAAADDDPPNDPNDDGAGAKPPNPPPPNAEGGGAPPDDDGPAADETSIGAAEDAYIADDSERTGALAVSTEDEEDGGSRQERGEESIAWLT